MMQKWKIQQKSLRGDVCLTASGASNGKGCGPRRGRIAALYHTRAPHVVACRFFYFHIVIFTYMCDLAEKLITKRIRRRGKKLVEETHIATTNAHGELFKAIVPRATPFRSASTDVGQTWGRCNIDLQFMPRALDPKQLLTGDSAQSAAPEVNPQLALAMYGVRLQLPSAPLLRDDAFTLS